MGVRRLLAIFAAAVATAAAAAPAAHAHGPQTGAAPIAMAAGGPLATASFAVRAWPRGVIPYYNAARKYDRYVREAARLWNRSGVRVRFKRVPRARAKVIVRFSPVRRSCHGYANLGYTPGFAHGVTLGLGACDMEGALQVTTHELGHIVGLPHTGRCAVMSTPPQRSCKQAKHPWQKRCRTLEAYDLAAARRLYGGRSRGLGPEFCDRVKIPAPPTAGVLHLGGAVPHLEWKSPAGAVAQISVARGATCDAARAAIAENDVEFVEAQAGKVQRLELPYLPKGPICLVLRAHDPFQRSAGELVVEGVLPNQPPIAAFEVTHEEPGLISLEATGSDPDGRIVSYRWELGDGNQDAGELASHRYASSGVYTVRLTVTDDSGATASSEQSVTITVPDPPVASFTFTDQPGSGYAEAYFDARGSVANGGFIEDYEWEFGDGDFGYGATTTHYFGAPGTYTVTLRVLTSDGRSHSTQREVTVTA